MCVCVWCVEGEGGGKRGGGLGIHLVDIWKFYCGDFYDFEVSILFPNIKESNLNRNFVSKGSELFSFKVDPF